MNQRALQVRSWVSALGLHPYRLAFLLIGLWLLVMIALPIAYWTYGDSIIPAGITAAAVVQALAVLVAIALKIGRRALILLVGVGVLTWLAEAIGSSTGFPFGVYHYTDVLQPQVAGVPLLVPLAWFMMIPSAWALAQLIIGDPVPTLRYRLQFALIAALALTAWDLFLDPQMVGWNFWQWAQPSGYFGIPWTNYLGWLLVAFIVSAVLMPPSLPKLPLVIVYACVWFLQSVGLAVFWGMPAPALCGSVAMAGVMLWAYRRAKVTQWT